MNNSYRYFENRECKYYPCHKGCEEINCLFCYCPMYRFAECLGNPEYITKDDGRVIKNCSACDFPHRYEHYDDIIKFLSERK